MLSLGNAAAGKTITPNRDVERVKDQHPGFKDLSSVAHNNQSNTRYNKEMSTLVQLVSFL